MSDFEDASKVDRDATDQHAEDPEECIGDPVEVDFATGEVTLLGSTNEGVNKFA